MRRSVVVQRHPHLRRWLISGCVVGLALTFVSGALLGRYGTVQYHQSLFDENRALRERTALQHSALDELQQWKINQQTRLEVSNASLEMVRKELAQQRELIAELEQGVRFYRSIMAPGEQPEGLSVRSIDLAQGPENGRYLFRILVQQNARKHDLLIGSLRVFLVGAENGESKKYSLASLSAELPAEDIKLRFRYFQAIDGEITLPSGFSPSRIIAYAKAGKPQQVEMSRDFPWEVQERITYVGK